MSRSWTGLRSYTSLADLEQETNCWLKANKLSLTVAKTEFMVIGSRQKLEIREGERGSPKLFSFLRDEK